MTTGTNKVAPQNSRMELGSGKSLAQGRRGSQMLRPANANTLVGQIKADPKKKGMVKKVDKFLDHWAVQGVLGLALFVTLFLPDLWVIINAHNEWDILLNLVLILFFVVFTLEIFLTSFAREEYWLSAFFWMDIIGTLSIIIDLTWVAEVFANSGGADPGTLRAARVAKLGAKAGRLAKLTKMFKFLNFGKEEKEDDVTPAKKISAKMGMLLSQRVALLIMTIVIINPFLSPVITDYSASGFLLMMDEVAGKDAFESDQWEALILKYKKFYHKHGAKNPDTSLEEPIWLKIRNIKVEHCPSGIAEWKSDACFIEFTNKGNYGSPIRKANKRYASSEGHGRYNGYMCSAAAPEFAYTCKKELQNVDALFDYTQIAVEESWLSIALICMVIVLLVGFTATFNMAVDDLVVKPISRIMEKLKKSAETVLKSVKQMTPEEEEDEDNALSETDVLEMMVNKLARIVQKSMSNNMQDVLDEHGAHGMDADTTAWLSSEYSTNRRKSDPNEMGKKLSTTEKREISTADLPVPEFVINSFKFDVLDVEGDKTLPVILYMFDKHDLLTEFSVDMDIYVAFVEKVKAGYKTEPQYHMWHHGCDVMHTVYQIMNATAADAYLSKLETFSSLVSALAHDIGHPGVNNGFLVKTKHELAMLHNDKSPLENMHASTLYQILAVEETNLMSKLTSIQFNDSRKIILTCILNTDMAFHFDNLKKLEMFEEVHGTFVLDFVDKHSRGDCSCPVPECLEDGANRLLLQECFLHAADLSNPVKPTPVYEKWVSRVTDEFFAQGDTEKGLGMPPSMMCDRDATNIPTMQMGFIDFIIFPFYSTLFKLFPDGLQALAEHLRENYKHYGLIAIKDAPDKETSLKERIDKMASKIDAIFSAE